MWIKVCGIRDVPTARQVAKLKPDAIGLNFYKETPRHVILDIAAQIVELLTSKAEQAAEGHTNTIEPVGLFVNHAVSEIIETCRRCGIQTVQLHGDETPQFLAELASAEPDLRMIRAYRLGSDGLVRLAAFLDECKTLAVNVAACLIDARVEGSYGGSGKTVPWGQLQDEYRHQDWPPLILAGGLRPDNVAEAIHTVRPSGVDVASGVESSPGCKDLDLVQRFIEQSRKAFAEVSTLGE